MKLPEARPGADWTRLRHHDIQELWEHSHRPHVASAYVARMEFLVELVSRLAGPGGRVLDVGCAQGTLGLMLAERGQRVTLLDVRAENIEYARARHERGEVEFCVGFLGEDTPPGSGYDVVVCTEVLEHVKAPAHLIAALAAKARPGGFIVLTTPNADYAMTKLPSFGRAPETVIAGAEENSLDGDAHRYLYTREELVALVRGQGLALDSHGFFVPLWLEGHAKLRHLHKLLYGMRGRIVRLPASLPSADGALSRRLCSSQWLVARRG